MPVFSEEIESKSMEKWLDGMNNHDFSGVRPKEQWREQALVQQVNNIVVAWSVTLFNLTYYFLALCFRKRAVITIFAKMKALLPTGGTAAMHTLSLSMLPQVKRTKMIFAKILLYTRDKTVLIQNLMGMIHHLKSPNWNKLHSVLSECWVDHRHSST